MSADSPFVLGAVLVAALVAVASTGGTDPVGWAAAGLLLYAAAFVVLVKLPAERLLALPVWPLLLVLFVLAQLVPLGGPPQSVAPYETWDGLLRLAVYLAGFYLAALMAASEQARRRLVMGLVALGLLVALYGLGKYLIVGSAAYAAVGPYANRNHFAGLLGMTLPLAVALAWRRRLADPGEESLRWWLLRPEAQKTLLGLVAATGLFVALLFSRSRMGLLAALAALLVMGALGVRRGAGSRRVALVAVLAVVVGTAALALWIGIDPVLARFEAGAFTDRGRISIWSDTLRLIGDRLWLGSGWGAYARAYPAVQTAHLGGFVIHAHNDYLEHAAELGLVGAALLWTGIGWVYLRALRRLGKVGRREQVWLWGCTGSLTALLVHSLADFNLHIPANALVFALVLGLTWGLARDEFEIVEAVE